MLAGISFFVWFTSTLFTKHSSHHWWFCILLPINCLRSATITPAMFLFLKLMAMASNHILEKLSLHHNQFAAAICRDYLPLTFVFVRFFLFVCISFIFVHFFFICAFPFYLYVSFLFVCVRVMGHRKYYNNTKIIHEN